MFSSGVGSGALSGAGASRWRGKAEGPGRRCQPKPAHPPGAFQRWGDPPAVDLRALAFARPKSIARRARRRGGQCPFPTRSPLVAQRPVAESGSIAAANRSPVARGWRPRRASPAWIAKPTRSGRRTDPRCRVGPHAGEPARGPVRHLHADPVARALGLAPMASRSGAVGVLRVVRPVPRSPVATGEPVTRCQRGCRSHPWPPANRPLGAEEAASRRWPPADRAPRAEKLPRTRDLRRTGGPWPGNEMASRPCIELASAAWPVTRFPRSTPERAS